MKKLFALVTIFLSIAPALFQSCGVIKFSAGLIINGDEVKRGEFPFLVSLFRLKNGNFTFFCGGNLITTKHTLTASHCIHDKYTFTPSQPQDIIVKLGKYNLKTDRETGEATKNISKIILHEDWNPNEPRYDADIALLVFDSDVRLSAFIQTVCLPTSSNLIEGQVVGYGVSERTDFVTPEDTPRKTTVRKPPSNEKCFLDDSSFASIASSRTFCAKGENSGPCVGDSGGGFYVKRNSIWYLQGIVSASLLIGSGECDVFNYAVYTNVVLYEDWILDHLFV